MSTLRIRGGNPLFLVSQDSLTGRDLNSGLPRSKALAKLPYPAGDLLNFDFPVRNHGLTMIVFSDEPERCMELLLISSASSSAKEIQSGSLLHEVVRG